MASSQSRGGKPATQRALCSRDAGRSRTGIARRLRFADGWLTVHPQRRGSCEPWVGVEPTTSPLQEGRSVPTELPGRTVRARPVSCEPYPFLQVRDSELSVGGCEIGLLGVGEQRHTVSIKQRLNPESGQVPVLVKHAAHARFVWNLALEQANCYRREQGPTPNTAVRMRQLTEAREASEWLRLGSAAVQQAALRDFDQAMKNWWGHTHRRPTWRKASRHNSFVVRDLTVARINRKWATVLIPKLGHVRFRLTRPFTDVAAASSARVSVDRSGRWWVSFTCPPPTFARTPTGKSVGVDRGA